MIPFEERCIPLGLSDRHAELLEKAAKARKEARARYTRGRTRSLHVAFNSPLKYHLCASTAIHWWSDTLFLQRLFFNRVYNSVGGLLASDAPELNPQTLEIIIEVKRAGQLTLSIEFTFRYQLYSPATCSNPSSPSCIPSPGLVRFALLAI